jgi:hypothetical protein
VEAVSAACSGAAPSDFSGLAPGLTYYAVDGSTGTRWAAARAVPTTSASGGPAGVCLQDDGSYWLFRQAPGASTWTATPDGAVTGPTTCPASGPPAAVVAVWGWPAETCTPPGLGSSGAITG